MDRIVSRHKLTWSPLQEKIPEENTIKSVPPATAVSKDSVEDLRNQIIELKATLSTRNEDTNRSRESHNTKYRAYCPSSSHDLRECYKENRLQVTASIVVDLMSARRLPMSGETLQATHGKFASPRSTFDFSKDV